MVVSEVQVVGTVPHLPKGGNAREVRNDALRHTLCHRCGCVLFVGKPRQPDGKFRMKHAGMLIVRSDTDEAYVCAKCGFGKIFFPSAGLAPPLCRL